MKQTLLKLTLITTALFATQINARNSDPMNLAPLSGDYVIGNPGFETAIPVWTRIDTDGDGLPESDKFRIDVYKVGTTTKLFSTPEKTFTFSPISNCKGTPHPSYFKFSKHSDYRRISNTLVVSVTADWGCDAINGGGYDGSIGYIYAVDLSAPTKTPWTKTYTKRLEGIGVLPDANSNGVGELFVMISQETPYIGDLNRDNVTVTTYIYDGLTGTSLTTPKSYALQQ
jgi:hypothetical protein